MIGYTWSFSNLFVKPEYSGLSDVLVSLTYTLTGVDGFAAEASVTGSLTLAEPNPETYTPFAQITKAQCEQWVEAAMGDALDVYKAYIESEIDKQKNPPLVERAAPWA